MVDAVQSRRQFLMTGSAAAALALTLRPTAALAATDITYWHHFTSQTEFAGLAGVMEDFHSGHPEINILQENIPNAEYMAKFTSAVIADSRADTCMVASERLADMIALDGLVDLTGRIDGWDGKQFYSDAAWDGITIDGKTYGVPAFSFVNWMYYRKDWLDEAGISPPDTFEEFVEAAIKLSDPGSGRYGFGMRGGDGGQSMLHDVFDSYGAFVYDGNSVTMDVPKAVEALTFYTDIFTKHNAAQPSAPGDSYRQIMEGFRTGQTGMIWHHTGSLTEISDALSTDQFATALRPSGPTGRIARVAYLYNGIMSDRHTDDSWSWIAHWGEPDAAITMLEATGYFPASSAVANDERITSNPLYSAAIETLRIGTPLPKIVGMAGWMRNSMLPEFQKVLVGTATPEQAVDAMARTMEREVR
ncbi:extracellular solute-binding protein [Bauldia sp.]|uniref:extracellular solute-binding protein n=1 Tax=Bauldia sp. TaxID=2575872 RepID=UPI003BAD05B8